MRPTGAAAAGRRGPAPAASAAGGAQFHRLFRLGSGQYNARGECRSSTPLRPPTGLAPGPVQVTGHTDTSGSAAFNQKLSVRRAQNVAKVLAQSGVPQDQMNVSGVGQNDLKVPTPDGVREAQNRRTEIVVGGAAPMPAAPPPPEAGPPPGAPPPAPSQ